MCASLRLAFCVLPAIVAAASKSETENPAFMMMSGISSTEDLCFVVENGNVDIERAEIFLESCGGAIAAGDGRELWKFMPSGQIASVLGKLCISLGEDAAVVLSKCDESDGNAKWEVQANGQLKNGQAGGCMTQKGLAAGVENVAVSAAVAASSSADVSAHGANMAVDEKDSTYWASKFDAGTPQSFTLDFGSKKKLQNVVISWEFPAKAFSVSLSTDGLKWIEAFATDTNVLNMTHIPLGYEYATKAKIIMREPHPRYGNFQGHAVYGIKSLGFFSPRLRTAVEDCALAATSSDARDKVFLSYVGEFEPCNYKGLRSELPALAAAQQSLSSTVAELADALPQMQSCRKHPSLVGNAGKQKIASALFGEGNHYKMEQAAREAHKSVSNVPSGLSRSVGMVSEQNGFDTSGIDSLLAEARETIVVARSMVF